jgi:hypothetical protein
MVKTISKNPVAFGNPRLKPWAVNGTLVFTLFPKNTPRLKPLALFLLLLNSQMIFAGGTVKVKGHKFVILPFVGALWQGPFFGEAELGHVYGIHYEKARPWRVILAYSKIGADFNPAVLRTILWAPEFSSEIDLGFICIRGKVEDYLQSRENKFYFTPEAGLTISGFVTLCAGYNKTLTKTKVEGIKPYCISISIMIPKAISGSSRQK